MIIPYSVDNRKTLITYKLLQLKVLSCLPVFSFQINNILHSRNRDDLIITDDEEGLMKELVDFLEPFRKETEKLQAEKTPTIQYVLLAFHLLRKHCSPKPSDSPAIAEIRRRCLKILLEKFDLQGEHKIATFLYPRYRNLRMLPDEERRKVSVEFSLR